MNLTGARPLGLKSRESGKDPAYLSKVRELSCVICRAFGEPQLSPTQAHHPIHGRFSQRKTPDRMAIAICEGHHQGEFDTSKIALHREPKAWREKYGADHEWIALTQDMIAKEIMR